MKRTVRSTRRKRCDECNELYPPNELERIEIDAWEEGTIVPAGHILVCQNCLEYLEQDDSGYETYGDREDQISRDSAMFRN